jgi:unsaturated chondroitin disaccharide hydrolase
LTHLEKSRDYLVRPDSSSFHTYHFDPASGAPLRGSSHQGAGTDSCWARGQAWGMYGFAINHRYAPELGLLDVAIRQADYFLARLPANGIAYWDLIYGDGSGEPWDSSASAIAVCGLLEIAELAPSAEQAAHYRAEAERLCLGLIWYCTGVANSNDALLAHGVYSKPEERAVDEGNLWGDFFYMEALMRLTGHGTRYW